MKTITFPELEHNEEIEVVHQPNTEVEPETVRNSTTPTLTHNGNEMNTEFNRSNFIEGKIIQR